MSAKDEVKADDATHGAPLGVVAAEVHELTPIKDHTYHLKKYKQCFLGSEMVDAMVGSKHPMCDSREEAVKLATILQQGGYIEHVTKEHNFEDSGNFFRFVEEKLHKAESAGDETKEESKTYEGGFDLAKESMEEGSYCKIAEDCWSFSEPHFPGGSKMMTLNNRGFVFAVSEKGSEDKKSLFLVGLPGESAIVKMKKLEKETGLKLGLAASSGDFHHMAIKAWIEAYPDVKIIMSGVRFPKTRNGASIMGDSELASHMELIDGTPESFANCSANKYSHIIRFFGFNQTFYYSDQEFMAADFKNPPKVSKLQFMKNMMSTVADAPCLCIWFYHIPTKSLVAEHNFAMYFSKPHHRELPFMMRQMMPCEGFCSALEKNSKNFPQAPKTLEGCKLHCAQFEYMLKEVGDARFCTDYHSWTGVATRRWESAEHFQEDMKKVLGVELGDGTAMHKKINGGKDQK